MSSGLTPFATFFMLLSMGSVTLLAGWCLSQILRGPKAPPDGD